MSESKLTLAIAALGVILQGIAVWQNRKPRKPKGRHKRE
ncbi:hypothetical protein SAMN05421671_4531 [Pimelobacter simplex]|nr:hypothetical protein SAMN05421671_4531 [Pimelobacter simplex]